MNFAKRVWRKTAAALVIALVACGCAPDSGSPDPTAIPGTAPQLGGGEVTRTRHTYKQTKQGPLDLFEYATPRVDDTPRPAIVLFHGGRWEEGHPKQFQPYCVRLAQRGFVAFSADYRVEFTHGTSPIEAAYDAKDAIRWVRDHARELGVDPNRVAAGGGSAGGHISAAAATIPELSEGDSDTDPRPDALVLYSGLVDMTPRDGLGYAKLGEQVIKASPLHHLDGDEPPTLILHGAHDDVASLSAAKRFHDTLRSFGVHSELVVYDAGHGFFNEFVDDEAYADTLRRTERFFESLGWIEADERTR